MKKMKQKQTKREFSPRLASRDIRVKIRHGLPEEIKYGIQEIAKMENQTVSWVLEQSIIDYFGLKRPRYKNGKYEHNR